MDKSTHAKHLSRPLQTNLKKIEIGFIFLTGYNGIINVANSNNTFYFKKSIANKDGVIEITIPQSASELESLIDEFRRIVIDEDDFTEAILLRGKTFV